MSPGEVFFEPVCHSSMHVMSPQDETLFRAFQSNLLSLISHELRTPLTGILNALSLLEQEGASAELSFEELVSIARRNAQRLNRTLAALLDLASLESGVFHARVREVDLTRLVRSRALAATSALKDRGIEIELGELNTAPGRLPAISAEDRSPVLADPQKMSRAIDLCLELVAAKAEQNSRLRIETSSNRVEFAFNLNEVASKEWDSSWSEALAGHQSGVVSPVSAFARTMQSEQAFLTRLEEGLGSEFLLIHEIMKIHQGKFTQVRPKTLRTVILILELPQLSSDDGLKLVLASRAYRASTELNSVALGLIQVPKGKNLQEFRVTLKRGLFRSSDAVYALPARNQLAVVLDDCKAGDAPRLLSRLEKTVGQPLVFGVAACPDEGENPELLIELAQKRLAAALDRGCP